MLDTVADSGDQVVSDSKDVMALLSRLRASDPDTLSRRIVLTQSIDLREEAISGNGGRMQCDLLMVVREGTRHGIDIEWSLKGFDRSEEELYHLTPPMVFEGRPDSLGRWRNRFLFGLLFWRNGGSFIMLKDRRASAHEKAVILLDHLTQVTCFMRLNSVTDVTDLDAQETAVLEEFVDLGLVLRCGAFALALPYRLSHWPVPYGLT